jgi:hypothetical protein
VRECVDRVGCVSRGESTVKHSAGREACHRLRVQAALSGVAAIAQRNEPWIAGRRDVGHHQRPLERRRLVSREALQDVCRGCEGFDAKR